MCYNKNVERESHPPQINKTKLKMKGIDYLWLTK
jgi:hypothetical protein